MIFLAKNGNFYSNDQFLKIMVVVFLLPLFTFPLVPHFCAFTNFFCKPSLLNRFFTWMIAIVLKKNYVSLFSWQCTVVRTLGVGSYFTIIWKLRVFYFDRIAYFLSNLHCCRSVIYFKEQDITNVKKGKKKLEVTDLTKFSVLVKENPLVCSVAN